MKSENQNRSIYDLLRDVPKEARKPITDGRLKGKTDVNAMWRIKRMTEVFGPCGFGWKYVIKSKELQTADGGNISAFVDIDLYVKHPETGEWSEPIPGTGGNIFQRIERSGNVYMDDDCYKKALTDAISIAAKALGMAADVWYEQDVSKYDAQPTKQEKVAPAAPQASKQAYDPMPKDKYMKYVRAQANGETFKGRQMLDVWREATNAGEEEVKQFLQDVASITLNDSI